MFLDLRCLIASQHGSWEGAWGLEEDEAMLVVVVVVVAVVVVVSEPELVLRFVSIAVVAVELMLRLSKSSARSSTHGCMMVKKRGESHLVRRANVEWGKLKRRE